MNEIMPDPDAIKMFIGQIPKNWNENDVRHFFEEYGRIYLINVLRDKTTKQSRGCCFITYYTRKSALDAQNACHNVKTIPGMNNSIQMKPADNNENRHERKIFIGMVSKKLNEQDIRILFSRFGLIEECLVLRDTAGQSRGCAFVTFSSKSSALNAIKAMHQSTIMEGCSSPLVVKFADTRKDKTSKTTTNPGVGVGTTSILTSPLTDPNIAQKTQYLTLLQLLQQQATAVNPLTTTNALTLTNPLANLQSNNTDLATLTLLAGLTGNNLSLSSPNYGGGLLTPNTQANNPNAQPFSLTNIVGSLSSSSLNSLVSNTATANTQMEGPEGSNLFIYHLPQEFTDTDLAQVFIPFGNVLSAKVFIDKTTNLSKCFGFISYDNQLSAQLAIQAMNGFQIGNKRLKVQLKRSKEKPY